ncbi:MAG: hypothetical protein LBT82_01570 [Oscillospiraceae bacterium]|jgi:sporulation integral membrane protein YlbJ|nr:hypothetical protein [Oscillospiraceae bacterium]
MQRCKQNYSKKKIFKILFIIIATAFVFFGLLFWNVETANGIKTGLAFCCEILIPSIFPFMMLSIFMVKSGLSYEISKIIDPFVKALFALPGSTGITILIGLLGGYPTGARSIRSLVEKKEISHEQAQRMLYFTVGAGPAFTITVVGCGLLKSYQIGLILFASQIIASLLIGITLGINNKKTLKNINSTNNQPLAKTNVCNAFIESCSDATDGMITMCSLVVLFCAVSAIIKSTQIENLIIIFLTSFGLSNNISKSILPILLEIVSGLKECVNLQIPLELISFALGWAGLCVHFQIWESMRNIKFSKLKFIFSRLIHGILSAVICYLILLSLPVTITAFNTDNSRPTTFNAYSFTSGSLALILLCACFLSTLTPKIINSKGRENKKTYSFKINSKKMLSNMIKKFKFNSK